ncbi:hypothetical protein HK405_001406, partial [Cladochytrium tenue]
APRQSGSGAGGLAPSAVARASFRRTLADLHDASGAVAVVALHTPTAIYRVLLPSRGDTAFDGSERPNPLDDEGNGGADSGVAPEVVVEAAVHGAGPIFTSAVSFRFIVMRSAAASGIGGGDDDEDIQMYACENVPDLARDLKTGGT